MLKRERHFSFVYTKEIKGEFLFRCNVGVDYREFFHMDSDREVNYQSPDYTPVFSFDDIKINNKWTLQDLRDEGFNDLACEIADEADDRINAHIKEMSSENYESSILVNPDV